MTKRAKDKTLSDATPQVRSSQTSSADSGAQARRILLASADAKFQAEVREILSGYVMLAAENIAALEAIFAGEQRPQVAIVDLDAADAENLLAWLQIHASETATVIAATERSEALAMRCFNQGAGDFLSRPLRRETVCRVVERAFKRHSRRLSRGKIEARNPVDGWMEITAPSEFEYLQRLQRFSDMLFATRLPRDTCEDLRVAIEEVGRNAIEWGNRFDPQKRLRISYCFFHDRVVLKFEDEGEGFKPQNLPDPSADLHRHLAERASAGKRPGGFGVLLVQSIMDKVVYSEKGNVVVMTKFLRKAGDMRRPKSR